MSLRVNRPDSDGWSLDDWTAWLSRLGVMHSVLPTEEGVCSLCRQPTPVGSYGTHYEQCLDCRSSYRHHLAAVVPISYSLSDGLTSVIWQAKNDRRQDWLRWPLASTLHRFLQEHLSCLERLAGGRFDVATVVPSHPGKRGGVDHLKRLHAAVRPWPDMWDLDLLEKTADLVADDRRKEVNPDLFRVGDGRQVQGRRILVVDDLFTSGGTLASAGAALMAAGARKPVAVTIGRQVSSEHPTSAALRERLTGRGLDLGTCAAHPVTSDHWWTSPRRP